MKLHNHSLFVNICNCHALITHTLEFENTTVNEETDTNNTQVLQFEVTINPQSFISSFTANLDNQLYIGQIKGNKPLSSDRDIDTSEDIQTNAESLDTPVTLTQLYEDIPNVYQITVHMLTHTKVILTLALEQYTRRICAYHTLTVELLRSFTKYDIICELPCVKFNLQITDNNHIHNARINGDTFGESKSLAKRFQIAGKLVSDSTNVFAVKYQNGKEKICPILCDINSKIFCHILQTDFIMSEQKETDSTLDRIIPRRVMYIIDKSESMNVDNGSGNGSKWQQCINAITKSIKSMRNGIDRFGVLLFNHKSQILTECVSVSDSVCEKVSNALQSETAKGQTNINDVLLKSIALLKKDIQKCTEKKTFFINQIILCTDGAPNIGENDTNVILSNVCTANNDKNNRICIFGFGIGTDTNDNAWIDDLDHSFLHLLSVRNNGFYRRVKESVTEESLNACLDRISKPCLCNLTMEYISDNITDLTEMKWGVLYEGSALMICGKIPSENMQSLEVKCKGITCVTDNGKTRVLNMETTMKFGLDLCENKNERIWALLHLEQRIKRGILLGTDAYGNNDSESAKLAMKYKLLTPFTSMTMTAETESKEESETDTNKPNIDRIMTALNNESALKNKYSKNKLAEMFKEFVDEEGYSDDAMEDEFGDGMRDDSAFNEWLKDEKGISDTEANNIWKDLNCAFKGDFEEKSYNIRPERLKTEFDRINYNINVTNTQLEWVKKQITQQCKDLLIDGEGRDRDVDTATYSIVQIGKQNFNVPILMYLVDSFNRFRIQRRRRFKAKYPDPEVYANKFSDIQSDRFIQDKCKGFRKWLIEYPSNKQKHFRDMCDASIKVFFRRLNTRPPMAAISGGIIDDSIVQISYYIFQCFRFIEQFTLQKNAPLPAQIDVVFVVNKYKNLDDSKESNADSDDEDDKDEQTGPIDVGDINQRLASQTNKSDAGDIEWTKCHRIMLQTTNSLIANSRCQRIVLIIDRRKKDSADKSKDKLYGYQPNDDGRNCHCFESDIHKFLNEGLVQNSRVCILPALENEKDIAVTDFGNPQCFTLSFHCLSLNRIQTYLYYNGWGTRFFIEDIKYFFPTFFVPKQEELLQYTLTQQMNSSFTNAYKKAQRRCRDYKFERFYKALIDGKAPH